MGSLDLSHYGLGGPVDDLARLCARGDGNACMAMVAMQRDAELARLASMQRDAELARLASMRQRDADQELSTQVPRCGSGSGYRCGASAPSAPGAVSRPAASPAPPAPRIQYAVPSQAPRAAAPGFFDTLFDAFTGGGSRGGSRPQGAAPRPGAPQRTAVSKPSGGSGDSAADMVGALTPITTTVTDALMRIEAGRAARRRTALAPAPAGGTWSTGAKVAAGVGGVLALGVLGKLIFGRKVST